MTFQEESQFTTPQKALKFTRFFYFLSLILLTIGIFHLLGIYGGFYWRYSWFDLVQHFLGGVWVGGIIMWYLSWLNGFITEHSILTVVIVLVGVLTVGIAWEIFEVVICRA